MSWRDPTDFERALLADTHERWPEVIPVARCLTLAPHIEPLLLRNARRRFVPQAPAEVESLLWFSPLVAARSTREIVLHLGVAKALAEEWMQEVPADLETLWRFTRHHTRHWNAEDRLERDLRYYALLENRDKLKLGLRDILRRIHAEQDEKRRVALSRLAKRTLPVIGQHRQGLEETRLLAQYAALALGDAGSWTQLGAQPGPPQALPAWLATKLPQPIASAELGVEIRHDARHGQVLHLVVVDAVSAADRIVFPSPLPARLHVAGEGRTGAWHTITLDSRIRITPPSPRLRLTTLDGRQWDLRTDELPSEKPAAHAPLVLAHVEGDEEQARAIAEWLKSQGLSVELLAESARAATTGESTPDVRVVRLWTRAAQDFWADRPMEQAQAVTGGLLLRTEPVDLPVAGVTSGQVLDWQDWSALDASPRAARLLDNLKRWRDGSEIEPEPATAPAAQEPAPEATYSKEIAALLAEIDDPATEPPRRLEIGDRLAELGDPRPGVGVIEIEVPMEDARGPTDARRPAPSAQPAFPPEVQDLLDEIDDPGTEPPRRLEVGDELERLGDPRHGVGLDEQDLPEIDWVEIPGGPFIYQDGETRKLPAFWLSRYPITNRQFQAFIDAGGYGKSRGAMKRTLQALGKLTARDGGWWQDLRQPDPEKSSWPQSNRPRTEVDWYEAVAFTRWLTVRLGLPEGTLRLPTEYEWEKAARGEKGLIYPWGDKYEPGFANINETARKAGPWYLKQTTAVGLYPQGRSPYGVEDLSGTVWEWCLNKYDQPDITDTDTSGDTRALRGGSWFDGSGLARADSRYGNLPDARLDLRGFRVLSSVPIAVR